MSEIVGGFSFHEKFSLWLQLMFNNLKFRVKFNRTMPGRFSIHKGTRQGKPLSLLI